MFIILHTVKKGDYLYAVVPDHPKATKHGYVLEHRVIMENFIGRLLYENEIVHHIDGNKKNNLIDNLEIMTDQEHSRIHAKRGRTVVHLNCYHCGKLFTRELRHVKGKGFCSRYCNGKHNQYFKTDNGIT